MKTLFKADIACHYKALTVQSFRNFLTQSYIGCIICYVPYFISRLFACHIPAPQNMLVAIAFKDLQSSRLNLVFTYEVVDSANYM